ncbi:MAG: ribosome recycling factor [Bacteroidales bacterium]|jgi:ribosome recycling factor|nr:ribosome recycling factor [Bacteroidales bacterium]
MNEQVKKQLDEARSTMQGAVNFLEKDLKKMRAGKASTQMLEGIKVDYYGNMTPIEQVGNINTPAANQITIQPWDKSALSPINKALLDANLGFTPKVEADLIRITLPPLTEERRKEIVKAVKTESENTKVSIRNIRRNILEKIKKLKDSGVTEDELKQAEKDMQDMTDKFVKDVDAIVATKDKEIMTI